MTAKLLFLEQFAKISGGQVVLLQILDSLDKKKYQPRVVLPAKGQLSEELDKRKIACHIFPIGNYSVGRKTFWDLVKYVFSSLLVLPLCVRLIGREKIDLVYANAPRTFFWGTLAANLTGKPIIWHLHSVLGGMELKLSVAFAGLFQVKKIIAISKTVAGPLLKSKPGLAAKIEIVYNGIDADIYKPDPAESLKIRKELGISEKCKLVGYVGQLARWKGVESLIRSAAILLNENRDVDVLIVGGVVYGGPKEQGYKDQLVALANSLGAGRRIKFLGRRDDIPGFMSMIDILVVPSIDPEPLSLALLEGMASAKAVVATNHGGPAEIITDGVNGRLFSPKDNIALAAILEQLVKNDELRERLGANARKKIAAELTVGVFAEKITKILDIELAKAKREIV